MSNQFQSLLVEKLKEQFEKYVSPLTKNGDDVVFLSLFDIELCVDWNENVEDCLFSCTCLLITFALVVFSSSPRFLYTSLPKLKETFDFFKDDALDNVSDIFLLISLLVLE